MAALALGVALTETTFTAAIWTHGSGKLLGTFPNTSTGAHSFTQQFATVCQEQHADAIFVLLEPKRGAEQLQARLAEQADWTTSLAEPSHLRRWAKEHGYRERAGIQGALMLARYASEQQAPTEQHEQLVSKLHLAPAGVTDPSILLPTHLVQALAAWLSTLARSALHARPLALTTIAVVLLLRLVDLKNLPSDLYGDIAIVIDYVNDIQHGGWPTYFNLSSGPLYHYLIMPVIWVTGVTYLGIKLASVLVSLAIILVTYLLGRELLDDTLGLLAAFCAGVSCWLLVFSRLGNSQILVPLLTIGAAYYALRAVRTGLRFDLVACALMSALGLYTYPQNFILPAVTFILLACLFWLGPGMRWKDLLIFAGLSFVFALPFAGIVWRNPEDFFGGYIGEKLPVGNEWLALIPGNLLRQLLSLHIHGDITFRSNPASLPQLDPLSGLLFLVGFSFWLLNKQRRQLSPVIFVPFLLLQLPAALVRNAEEVPSASRALGIVPFVAVLVASGLWWLINVRRIPPHVSRLILPLALTVLVALNGYRYFVVYARGLPNQNTAFGQIIADYIDQLPPQTQVYVIGCCWGDAGQPHPYAISYGVSSPRPLHLMPVQQATCPELEAASRPTTVIWNRTDNVPAPQLAPCLGMLTPQMHLGPHGEPVFQSVDLPPP